MSRAKRDIPREPNGRPSRRTGNPPGGSKPHGPAPLRAVLTCKATAGEQEAVRAAAEAAGTSESAWMRRAVQEALGRADHARLTVAHLDAMGGMPSATG